MSEDDIPEPDRLEDAPHPRAAARLFGQAAAEAAFLASTEGGRIHHGWLLTGPRGIGKATLAWRMARHLVTQGEAGPGLFGEAPAPPDSLDMDPEHPVFRRSLALGEPSILLCRRGWDEKAKRLKTQLTVDEVRRLKGFFQLSATEGGWRVAIIDAVDEMNPSAANALLKILEEPPARSVLLLVCHRPAAILPTIRSRCRELRLSPLGPEDMAEALGQAGFGSGPPDADLAALAAGSVGEAVRLLSDGGAELYRDLMALIAEAPGLDRLKAIALAETAAGRGKEARYDLIVRLLSLLIARLARLGAGAPPVALVQGEAELAARLVPGPEAARIWAEALQEITGKVAHARAVNLDPAGVILDMVLNIEKTAAEAGRRAA